MSRRAALDLADVSAAFADLGTIVPIVAALLLVNGADPVATLAVFGALFLAAGLVYRAPVPVQPIKAAAAIAIATRAPAGVVAGAGLILGLVLVALAALRAGPLLVRLFPKPVIRGNQLGVGLLLLVAGVELVRRSPGDDNAGLLVTGGVVALVAIAGGGRFPAGLAAAGAGMVWTLAGGGLPAVLHPAPDLPSIDLPGASQLAMAATLLVLPQLPLTLGNAVVGTADLARQYLGEESGLVRPQRLMLTSGLANVAAGMLGGVPVCHGSSGLTAYHRLGARGHRTNLVAGGLFLAVGLLYGRRAPAVLALIPLPVLGGLLAYTGARHALLVTDQRGGHLAVALAMGAVGGMTHNLLYAMAVGMPACAVLAAWGRFRAMIPRAGLGPVPAPNPGSSP